MMLRWQRADHSMTTVSDVSEFTHLGTFGRFEHRDGEIISVFEEEAIPEFGHLYEMATVFHRLPLARPREHLRETEAYVLYRQVLPGNGFEERVLTPTNVHVIRCHGMWLLNDHADTIDTIVSPGDTQRIPGIDIPTTPR